jgi:hypothetical protein
MNYSKIDGSLLAALEEIRDPEQRSLLVFIIPASPPRPADEAALKKMGFDQEVGPKRIVTATLSATMVEQLSEMEWVRALRLSQKLRLLPQKDEGAGPKDWEEPASAEAGREPLEEFETRGEPDSFEDLNHEAPSADEVKNQTAGAAGSEELPEDMTPRDG